MSRTPTTPFIPPLLSPHPSPNLQPSPVIPPYTPAGAPGNYPVYPAHSPYAASPFIPPSPSAFANGLPPQHSRQNSRQGVSADYTGYPGGYPPPANTPVIPPPMHAYTPHPGYNSAPGSYQTFMQAGQTPWSQPTQMQSPYMPPGGARMPPGAPAYGTPYTPYGAPLPPPGAAWGSAPAQQQQYYQPPPVDLNAWYGQPPPGATNPYPPGATNPYGRPAPEPPAPVFDRMDPFTPGNHYGPVLDPLLIKVVKAPIKLNPLILPPPDDGPEQPYLKWDMLFPTSTVQRSDDPAHISWYNGREQPATFPRVTSLHIVSAFFPWMILVKAKDLDRGVTCGEVIEAIGYDMNRLSSKQDYDNLPPREKVELGNAYKHNRSPIPGVPGGQLGHGMKRLDFLRKYTMFAGMENDERAVKRICGETLPCVFVLRCAERYRTERDVQEQEARMRSAAAQQRPRSASRGARSRASSVNARITVQPPSASSRSAYDNTSDSDSGDIDFDHR